MGEVHHVADRKMMGFTMVGMAFLDSLY